MGKAKLKRQIRCFLVQMKFRIGNQHSYYPLPIYLPPRTPHPVSIHSTDRDRPTAEKWNKCIELLNSQSSARALNALSSLRPPPSARLRPSFRPSALRGSGGLSNEGTRDGARREGGGRRCSALFPVLRCTHWCRASGERAGL